MVDISFTLFALPFTLEKFANYWTAMTKKVKISALAEYNLCATACGWTPYSKLECLYQITFLQKIKSFWKLSFDSRAFFMATTLEVIFFLICFELVARLNYVTKTLKLLRKMATINVNTPACKLILYAEDFSTLFKQNMWLKRVSAFFVDQCNAPLHVYFGSCCFLSYTSSSGYPSLIFVSIACYSIVHYFIFSLCADHLKN